jgi:pyridoxine kinase
MMKKKKILLINDMAGYGKVATAAMLPILSYMGHPTYNLPTALVSNTLDYGKFNILETTDYIKGVFPVWKELGFTFDAIATGFITSERQARIVSAYCTEQAANGTAIYVDPIMGDEGKLYNGVTPAAIQSMREMIAVAHLIFPNYTEACYLTDTPYNRAEGVTRARGPRSHRRAAPNQSTLGAHHQHHLSTDRPRWWATTTPPSSISYLPYTEIPVHFPGTGDIFSAVLIGHLHRG